MFGLGRTRIGKLDPNSLSSFEREFFEALLASEPQPNTLLLSLRSQVEVWVKKSPFRQSVAAPDWLNRTLSGNKVRIEPKRLIGDFYSVPCSTEEILEVRTSGAFGVCLSKIVHEAGIRSIEFVFESKIRDYPEVRELELQIAKLEDDRPYWRRQLEAFPTLAELAARLVDELDAGSLGDAPVVVLSQSIDDPEVSSGRFGSLGRLLEFSNGFVVDDLQIYGLPFRRLLESPDSGRILPIGYQGENALFLEVDEDDLAVDNVLVRRANSNAMRASGQTTQEFLLARYGG